MGRLGLICKIQEQVAKFDMPRLISQLKNYCLNIQNIFQFSIGYNPTSNSS